VALGELAKLLLWPVSGHGSMHTKPGGRRNRKMDQLPMRKAEREQKLPGKNTLLVPRIHGTAALSC